ncbi:hypothetical protein KDRO_E03620 [Kluyveromyces lactis]|nr:hypothetical protein KDRO_E03620 [Kluyveromyces lactis]
MSTTTTSTPSSALSAVPSATTTSADIDNNCWGLSCSSHWEWARWVIFVIFMFILLAFVITTIRINYIRRRNGQQPLRYVSWLTPPTYRQSEAARNRSDVPLADYVPPYTEEANENDLGYYDRDGIFHVNSKADPPPPIDAYVLEHRNDRDTDMIDLEMQRTTTTAQQLPAYNDIPEPETAEASRQNPESAQQRRSSSVSTLIPEAPAATNLR